MTANGPGIATIVARSHDRRKLERPQLSFSEEDGTGGCAGSARNLDVGVSRCRVVNVDVDVFEQDCDGAIAASYVDDCLLSLNPSINLPRPDVQTQNQVKGTR